MTQRNLKNIKELSVLINQYVKQMKWKPMWGLPYDSYLWSITRSWAKECGLKLSKEDVWSLALHIANKMETVKHG